ncbi:MAG: hypothetical protein IJ875_02510 [Solobacterium sp.]|nr:hypothetical protein [Solobacterium sp.]
MNNNIERIINKDFSSEQIKGAILIRGHRPEEIKYNYSNELKCLIAISNDDNCFIKNIEEEAYETIDSDHIIVKKTFLDGMMKANRLSIKEGEYRGDYIIEENVENDIFHTVDDYLRYFSAR